MTTITTTKTEAMLRQIRERRDLDRAGKTLAELRTQAIASIIEAGHTGGLDHHDGDNAGDEDALFDLAAHWLADPLDIEEVQVTAKGLLEAEGRTWATWV